MTTSYRPRRNSYLSSQRAPLSPMRQSRNGQCGGIISAQKRAGPGPIPGSSKLVRHSHSQLLAPRPSSRHSEFSQNAKKSVRAEAIPLPSSHIPRTKSELQLHEDTAAAEWADMCMFHRLVTGMRERQHRLLESSSSSSEMATIQEQRQEDGRQQHQKLLPHPRSSRVRPVPNAAAPAMQAERCISSIISTRHSRDVVAEATDIPATNNNAVNKYHHQADLRSTLYQAASEDWSLEGFADISKISQGNQQDDDNDEDEDGGIFSLDL